MQLRRLDEARNVAPGSISNPKIAYKLLNKMNNPIPIAGPANVANTTITNDLAAITLTPHYYKKTANPYKKFTQPFVHIPLARRIMLPAGFETLFFAKL